MKLQAGITALVVSVGLLALACDVERGAVPSGPPFSCVWSLCLW
jgi:hypothetical protein